MQSLVLVSSVHVYRALNNIFNVQSSVIVPGARKSSSLLFSSVCFSLPMYWTGDSRLRNCVDHQKCSELVRAVCASFWDFFRQLTPEMLSVRRCSKCGGGEDVVTFTSNIQHSGGAGCLLPACFFVSFSTTEIMRATFRGEAVAALLPPNISCVPDISRVPTFAGTIACWRGLVRTTLMRLPLGLLGHLRFPLCTIFAALATAF